MTHSRLPWPQSSSYAGALLSPAWAGEFDITAAMFFTSAGLLAGPVFGLLDFSLGSEEVKLVAEITLTLVLFADASRISVRALRREYVVPLRLFGIGLPLTIAAGAAVGIAVLPGVSLVEALVLAIMLACIDAALGQAVVTDRRRPSTKRGGFDAQGLHLRSRQLATNGHRLVLPMASADELRESAPLGRGQVYGEPMLGGRADGGKHAVVFAVVPELTRSGHERDKRAGLVRRQAWPR